MHSIWIEVKIFETINEQCKEEILSLEEITKRYSFLRLASFIISFIVIIALANERLITWVWIVTPLSVFTFTYLLVRYNQFNNQKQKETHLKEVNENELLRLSNELSKFPTGTQYLKENHAFIADLDVFGPHSVFQLLNRTTTESGSERLANWLSKSADKETINDRQEAIQDLKPKLKWRQQFEVSGLSYKNTESDYQKLLKWFDIPEQLLPKQTLYLSASISLGVISTTLAVLCLINIATDGLQIYLPLFLLVTGINYSILKKVAPIAEETIDHTHYNVQILGGYEMLAQNILSEKFESKKLKLLQADLIRGDATANKEIKQLRKILEIFQLRGTRRSDNNKFYVLFNIFWLFDIYWILLTEKWKFRNRKQVPIWIEAISNFEALNSLAGFAYANTDYVFPEIKAEPYHLDFQMIGHPLIATKSRVCNNFSLKERGQIAMITGSNMAGKSTFLRTIGVNLVLAYAGAPCCSKSAGVSSMTMFTSMRTQDNLIEGVSSFYAELKRVEHLLKLIESGQPIFFMLDEMFKGTNSEDRYKGGVSLIKQLNELNAFGIISTHDLELAKLAGHHMIVSNHSFNSKIKAGILKFDYKLQGHICTDFNASELMKNSGIKIINDIEKMD
ncbi:MutS-related protein [Roseivirga sp.]|uniref:MutS-related protein n=1 Tax=Roseivirga sp. TaxID=1964215 RepID=UPI003B8B7005